MTCHHRLWTAHTVERRRVWLYIAALGLHAWLDDIGRGKASPPLDSTHGRQRRACHDITALGQHTRSNYVERGMKSPPLDSTHDRMTSAMTCQHRLSTTHMVGLRRAWHDIIAFRHHTLSNNVGQGMPSSPLGSTHSRMMSGVACHHSPWTANTIEQRQA